MAVLPNLEQQNAELVAKLAAMQAQLDVANKPKAISLKVSEKGALSIYGMGRFPITLYKSQFTRLFHPETLAMIERFTKANDASFKVKGE